jgi:hypothetical protein
MPTTRACIDWMEARRARVLPTDKELQDLHEQVVAGAGDWYESVLTVRSHVTDAKTAKALSWPLAFVFLSNVDYEHRAGSRVRDGDRAWLAVVAHALIATGVVRGGDVYDGEKLALRVLGDQVVRDAWERHEPVAPSGASLDLDSWSYDVLFGIAVDAPSQAWALCLRMMTSAESEDAARHLSVHWLEVLWHQHGDEVIGWLEAEAAGNARFRHVLRGCLLPADRPDLAERIQAAAVEPAAS